MAIPMSMASGPKVYASLLQNESLPSPSHLLDSLWDPSFQGSSSKALVDFENVNDGTGEEELYDACFRQAGKKRRLTSEQVQFLERSFEVENKLEPERKSQLAKELGLQPRQVAIWFQNRRARFKTKQLEKDYNALKTCFDKLKTDYDSLLHQNDELKQEVNSLKSKLMEKSSSSCGDDAVISNTGALSEMVAVMNGNCKQEDATNSAKSDVFDSDSPQHHTADSSTKLETEQCSEFSQQEEEDNLMTILPKVEDDDVCDFGFPDEDQTFCFWPY